MKCKFLKSSLNFKKRYISHITGTRAQVIINQFQISRFFAQILTIAPTLDLVVAKSDSFHILKSGSTWPNTSMNIVEIHFNFFTNLDNNYSFYLNWFAFVQLLHKLLRHTRPNLVKIFGILTKNHHWGGNCTFVF